MPAPVIESVDEVRRWYEAGRTYAWMVEQYAARGITVAATTFSQTALRQGWERRITRDADLIPWHVATEHRWQYPVTMLRALARLRDGRPLTPPRAVSTRGSSGSPPTVRSSPTTPLTASPTCRAVRTTWT